PRWLDTLAVQHNINFSNILQNALMRELGVSKA
ncbi:MAG: type II toxin-antitoxin system HicB family antitoxin, partial [Selenomonas sp.]|nr:type II toxin-antitoxin system HicB family antitoxin [Selenomonas sp.]